MSNVEKAKLLGMPFGTAAHRLRKAMLFRILQETGKDTCFRCGQVITTVDDLSVEHKQPWQSAPNPKASFFDLDNVAFSHCKCNYGAARRERIRCPQGHVYTDENTRNCVDGSRQCRQCFRKWDKEYWHNSGKAGKRKQRRNSQ